MIGKKCDFKQKYFPVKMETQLKLQMSHRACRSAAKWASIDSDCLTLPKHYLKTNYLLAFG
ncbi:hypothetical protein BTO15_12395 [Polaribacter sejongensis]|uniref:Uncharacterized protein n=1 Tax=Polaribacter sejongensis TaxID=985043 RepID=A0ABM6Q120_9FLAO|nr:hypothetical protein BTO15_12395 [Polaribacter sejongensis]